MLAEEKKYLELVSRGDEAAFREIFGYYYPKVMTFLGFYISSEEDIRDLAQNIFVKIWIMRESLADIRSFGPYLYRLCRNQAVNFCHRRKIKIPLSGNYTDMSDVSMEEEYFAKEKRRQYEKYLSNMPERRRQVFSMSRYEGLSNEEISRQLGISKKTVENHITTVLQDLRKITSCILIFL